MICKHDRTSIRRIVIPILVLVLTCSYLLSQESKWIMRSPFRPNISVIEESKLISHTYQLNTTNQTLKSQNIYQINETKEQQNSSERKSSVEIKSVFTQEGEKLTEKESEASISNKNKTLVHEQLPTELVDDVSFLEPRANIQTINESINRNHSLNFSKQYNSTNISNDTQDESFSSCLLVMDENFRLYEWLSYHYHVLPLRYVVIAVDPRSHLSPEPVLDLFRRELNMTIITWTDDDYVSWTTTLPINASSYQLAERYLERQRRFIESCIQHMQLQGKKWTALWDVDEYISINGYDRVFGNVTLPSDLSESGVILKVLQQVEHKICFSMIRIHVGTKESTVLNQTAIPNLQPERLDTLRYLYKNHHGGRKVGNGLGKVFLNVQNVTFPINVPSPHRPVRHLCPAAPGNKESEYGPFYILHYIGSWEAYNFRSQDARIGTYRTWGIWQERSNRSVTWMPKSEKWLEGFVQDVGIDRAWKLLRHAGLPDGYNMSTTGYESFLAWEESQFR
jgi:hypothetical protein